MADKLHKEGWCKNEPSVSTAEQIGKEYGVFERTVRRDAEFSSAVDKVAEELGNNMFV